MTTLENRPYTALLVVDVQNGVVAGTHERDAVVANVGSTRLEFAEAIRLTASIVGAMTLARPVDDEDLSREILAEVIRQYSS